MVTFATCQFLPPSFSFPLPVSSQFEIVFHSITKSVVKPNPNPNPNSNLSCNLFSTLNLRNYPKIKTYYFSSFTNTNFNCKSCASVSHLLGQREYRPKKGVKANEKDGFSVFSQLIENGHVASFEVRDPLKDAKKAAFLRAQESLRPDSLFQDPYAAALAGEGGEGEEGGSVREKEREEEGEGEGYEYVAATAVIDKALIEAVGNDSVRQVVLLTDGMDTRPLRLTWPPQTRIFDVSPSQVYNHTTDILQAVGAKLPRGVVSRHVSADVAEGDDWRDEGWGEKLVRMGYRGDLPSVWMIQGLESMTEEGLQGVLGHVACMASEGALFVGEIPLNSLKNFTFSNDFELTTPDEKRTKKMEIFFSNFGLSVQSYSYSEMAKKLGRSTNENWTPGTQSEYKNVLFSAVQRRLSDAQVEILRFEMQRAEDEGDETGFEDSV